MNQWSEFRQRSWEHGSGLLLSLLKSSLFLSGLVEESLDQRSDMLSQMGSLDCVVVLWH